MTQQSVFQLGVFSTGTDKKEIFSTTFDCELLRFRMVTKRDDDGSRPTTRPMAYILEVTLSYSESPSALFAWYFDNTLLSGRIESDYIHPKTTASMKRTIRFYDAQCFSMDETFHQDKTLRKLTMKIAMDRMVVDNQEFKRS